MKSNGFGPREQNIPPPHSYTHTHTCTHMNAQRHTMVVNHRRLYVLLKLLHIHCIEMMYSSKQKEIVNEYEEIAAQKGWVLEIYTFANGSTKRNETKPSLTECHFVAKAYIAGSCVPTYIYWLYSESTLSHINSHSPSYSIRDEMKEWYPSTKHSNTHT